MQRLPVLLEDESVCDPGWDAGDIESKPYLFEPIKFTSGKTQDIQYVLLSKDNKEVARHTMHYEMFDTAGNTTTISLKNEALRLNANQAYEMPTNESWQITLAGEEPEENAWTMNGEIIIGHGEYELHIKHADGTIETKTVTSSTATGSKTEDVVRSFLKAITFELFYNEDSKLTIESDLTDMQINVNGKWKPYSEPFYINNDFKGTLELRGTDANGKRVSEYITL